jgi:eukaryotic-like serine/threonine-protein kinase
VALPATLGRKLVVVTVNFFSRRRGDGPPSTQFAATIVAMPGSDLLQRVDQGADAPNPDTLSPDSLVLEASGADSAVPDVVTDIGGLPSEVPDPADAPTLSHIGRYALKRQLGSGGIGTVFEAWDPLLSRAVAVKTLQFDVEHSARLSLDGLFLNEARAAASLNHRYIVTIHDAGLSAHGVYIAMERLYGRDLQQALADGWRPTVEQALQLVRRVTEALAYAHARGVVHCDIKPANIFLLRRDRPKVLDFGIARIVHGAALPALEGALVGSPRYRAPEQLTGEPVDARTDLFSLGVVTYELLTGRRAFEGDTLADINAAVRDHDPTPVHLVDARIPPEVSAIVQRMMARSPADRYTCASELSADLRRWILEQQSRQQALAAAAAHAAQPRPSTESRWPTQAPATRPRSTRWLWAGGLALAIAAGVAGLVSGPQDPGPDGAALRQNADAAAVRAPPTAAEPSAVAAPEEAPTKAAVEPTPRAALPSTTPAAPATASGLGAINAGQPNEPAPAPPAAKATPGPESSGAPLATQGPAVSAVPTTTSGALIGAPAPAPAAKATPTTPQPLTLQAIAAGLVAKKEARNLQGAAQTAPPPAAQP